MYSFEELEMKRNKNPDEVRALKTALIGFKN
jgi:hypothetical protein